MLSSRFESYNETRNPFFKRGRWAGWMTASVFWWIVFIVFSAWSNC